MNELEPEEETFDEPEDNTDYRNIKVTYQCNLINADEGLARNSDARSDSMETSDNR